MLLAVNPVARIFGPNIWAWLSDHHGARGQLIRLTAVGTAVTLLRCSSDRGIGWMFTALLVLNIFWCAVLPLAESATLNLLGSRVGTYGRIRVWGSVGFVVVVVAGGYLLDHFGIDALAPMVLTLLVLMAASTFPLPRDREPSHHGEHAPILRIVPQPAVVALFAGFFLMEVAHGPYNGFYSIHLVEAGYSKKAVGWLWALGVIAEIGLFLWLPRLMRAFSLNQILMVSFGCAFVRFLLIGWGVAVRFAVMVVAQLMHAATFGAYHAAGVAAMHQFFRGRNQARGQALYTSLGFGLGGTLGGCGGYAWEAWGAAVDLHVCCRRRVAGPLVVAWKPMSLRPKP